MREAMALRPMVAEGETPCSEDNSREIDIPSFAFFPTLPHCGIVER